jgi:hypothetical protein
MHMVLMTRLEDLQMDDLESLHRERAKNRGIWTGCRKSLVT